MKTVEIEGGDELRRGLSNRHIQLISIGGAIGTGLFWVPERLLVFQGLRSY